MSIKQSVKKIYSIVLLATAFLFLSISTKAQQGDALPENVLNDMLVKFRKIQADAKARQQFEKELEAIVDEAVAKLDKWLLEQKKEQELRTKSYTPGYKHNIGEMNLFPIWEEMPGPVPSLPEAKQTNFKGKYQSYIDKVNAMKKQLSDMMVQHVNDQRTNQQSMMEESKAIANRNAMVQEMGGADALMKMSEKERKQAAKQAAENVKANPAKATGIKNDGMNAMAQRMMNDPAYREAYTKMTDKQKEAELKKYMGNTIQERDDKAFEASLRERNNTNNTAAIEQLLGKCFLQMQDAAKPFSDGTELANKFYNSVYQGLDRWYDKAYASLPETNMHEKIGLDILIKCKGVILYAFHKKEAATRTILWNLLKENTKIAFGEFNDFIGSYQWGKQKNTSLIDGTYTEAKVAEAVGSLYDDMSRMAAEAEHFTWTFKGQQEQYEFIIK